jgi:predicted flap endonuclease-1-like 5' DNA nuclease
MSNTVTLKQVKILFRQLKKSIEKVLEEFKEFRLENFEEHAEIRERTAKRLALIESNIEAIAKNVAGVEVETLAIEEEIEIPLSEIEGIGEARMKLLKEAGIETANDLAYLVDENVEDISEKIGLSEKWLRNIKDKALEKLAETKEMPEHEEGVVEVIRKPEKKKKIIVKTAAEVEAEAEEVGEKSSEAEEKPEKTPKKSQKSKR